MQTSQSFTSSHSRLYKVKKKIHFHRSSQKTLKIAKRIQSSPGFPKPLTCEEDFVIEQNKTFSNFLKSTSSFYDLPQLPDTKKYFSLNEINPRNIVGPIDSFEKQWKICNESRVQGQRKGRSFINFNHLTTTGNVNFFKVDNNHIEKNDKRPSKIRVLYEKQKEYWKKLNENIDRKVTVKKNTNKKTTFLMVPEVFEY